jgi:hypothetical protein
VSPGAAPRRTSINPALLVVGGIVVVAIVIGAAFMTIRSRSGSIAVNPPSFSCDLTLLAPVTMTITLPSSVGLDDYVSVQTDGIGTGVLEHVGLFFQQQSDGSWREVEDAANVDLCATVGYAAGTHDLRILDSSGKVLAQGSYTVTP